MSEATTVPAGLMAAGVGEPAVWRNPPDATASDMLLVDPPPAIAFLNIRPGEYLATGPESSLQRTTLGQEPLDLTDPTTERECLAQLAEWCGEDGRGAYWLARRSSFSLATKGYTLRRAVPRILALTGPVVHSEEIATFGFCGSADELRNGRPVHDVAAPFPNGATEALAAILCHIGRDSVSRQWLAEARPQDANAWKPTPGTLARLVREHGGWWLRLGEVSQPFHTEDWALVGITDHHEAHVAIWKGVAS